MHFCGFLLAKKGSNVITENCCTKEQLALSASLCGPVNSKAENTCKGFGDITANSPERGSVGVFGKCLRLLGRRAVGSHFLSAGGHSVIQQALAGLETLKPISARDMPSTETILRDNKKAFLQVTSKLNMMCSLCYRRRDT